MLPIAQLTSAKTPEQAAAVVRSWMVQADKTPAGQDGKPDQSETTTQDSADAQAGSVPATADAQPTPKRKGK